MQEKLPIGSRLPLLKKPASSKSSQRRKFHPRSRVMVTRKKDTRALLVSVGCSLLVLASLQAQDAKIVADNLEYSREFYSGVHFSAIAESQPSFGYQRYPDNAPERIQCDQGRFARKQHGTAWLKSA